MLFRGAVLHRGQRKMCVVVEGGCRTDCGSSSLGAICDLDHCRSNLQKELLWLLRLGLSENADANSWWWRLLLAVVGGDENADGLMLLVLLLALKMHWLTVRLKL